MNSIRMRFPGGLGKAFTMSYDDGVQQDKKLISMMREHGVKGTFNLNAGLFAPEGTVYPAGQIHRRMTLSECKETYAHEGIEVAIHGYTHPFLETLPTALCMSEITKDREGLEEAFGGIVRGAAYPYGTFNDDVITALSLAGIAYCRTVRSTHGFDIPSKWLTLDPTCHHNDPMLNEIADKFVSAVPDRNPMLFYLWGHAYEFEANDNWNVIEELLDKVSGKEDIWYATNIEIYDYVKAFRSLIFSADGCRVYNPTDKQIWFTAGKTACTVAPGATIEF